MCLNIILFWEKKKKEAKLIFLQLMEGQRLEQTGVLRGSLAAHAWSAGLHNLQKLPPTSAGL